MKTTTDILILATHNEGKLAELKQLLNSNWQILSAKDFNLIEPEETATNYIGNAQLKAEFVGKAIANIMTANHLSNYYCLSDDSGLSIPILNHAPNIHSARWAETINADGKKNRNFDFAINYIKTALIAKGKTEQELSTGNIPAYFTCALALYSPKLPQSVHTKKTLVVVGECHGNLVFPKRGNKGFGYDPIFIPCHPMAAGKTFGELSTEIKDQISHRSIAWQKLKQLTKKLGINL